MNSNKFEQNTLKEEKVIEQLKDLYFMNGYSRYKMSNFENYDMYVNYKDFLNSTKIVTFTDAKGKLKALKPDVTMSIIKNTKDTDTIKKVFYIESVFRTMPVSGDIREIRQMGVEFIGCSDVYSQAETVMLAMQSLETISEEYMLNISHMGFVTGLLNSFNILSSAKDQMKEAIKSKNTHELLLIAKNSNCTDIEIETLKQFISLSGGFDITLQKAKQLICCEQMEMAYNDLCNIYSALKPIINTEKFRLDFSITSNADYYNGIMLNGYVKKVPSAVLVGGRYDNMMKRFNKPQKAFGFAVYLAELDRAFASENEYDIETLLIYKDTDDALDVMRAVKKLQVQYKSVMAINQNQMQNNLRFKTVLNFKDIKEVLT